MTASRRRRSFPVRTALRLALRLALAVLLLAGVAAAQTADEGPLELEGLGVVFVSPPGEPDADGRRARATVLTPPGAENRPAVVMLPGLGLEASIWLSSPDGREGWAQRFVRAGFPVWAVDPPGTVAAGIDAAAFASESPPGLFSWGPERVWTRWGLGPEPRVPFEDVRFPVEAFDVFLGSLTPVVREGRRDGGNGGNGVAPPPALVALLERTGPAVLVAHSAAGETVFALAAANPGLVRAIVVIEPVGCPDTADAAAALAGIPFFWMFGDYIEQRNQSGRLAACSGAAERIRTAGGTADGVWLPEEEIFGNTHLLMLDDNSVVLAARVIAWLNEVLE